MGDLGFPKTYSRSMHELDERIERAMGSPPLRYDRRPGGYSTADRYSVELADGRRVLLLCQGGAGFECVEDGACEEAFEAADGFSFAFAFGLFAFEVGAGGGVVAGLWIAIR